MTTLPPKEVNTAEASTQRGSLLSVPTRTSSVRNQNSPASTASTAVTATGDMEEGGAGTKRRKRDSSRASSINSAGGRQAKSQKPGGIGRFFSAFLNCCRAPDSNDATEEERARKSSKPLSIGSRKSSPVGSKNAQKESGMGESKTIVNEKDDISEVKPAEPASEKEGASSKPVEKAPQEDEKKDLVAETPSNGADAEQAPSEAAVRAEPSASADSLQQEKEKEATATSAAIASKDKESDVVMADAESTKKEAPVQDAQIAAESASDDADVSTLPGEQSTDEAIAHPEDQEQKWLLPPLAPEFKGKKCLVLDLDETLVHSSFKVCAIYTGDFQFR